MTEVIKNFQAENGGIPKTGEEKENFRRLVGSGVSEGVNMFLSGLSLQSAEEHIFGGSARVDFRDGFTSEVLSLNGNSARLKVDKEGNILINNQGVNREEIPSVLGQVLGKPIEINRKAYDNYMQVNNPGLHEEKERLQRFPDSCVF